MGNHVVRDRLWESNRLRRCSKGAALAYPWIFLVADDHGRFEYNPRRIWSKVFGNRDDVTLEEVSGWLDEYWREGLLVRYHIDGDLAYWYNFQGRKASERRPSTIIDPAGFTALSYPSVDLPRVGAEKRGAPREIDPRAEIDQIGDRAEQSGSGAEAETEGPATARDDGAEDTRRAGPVGEAERLRAEVAALRDEVSALTGKPPDEVMFDLSNTGTASMVNPEGAPLPWLRVTLDKLKGAKIRAQRAARLDAPRPAEPEPGAWAGLEAQIPDLAERFTAWLRDHPGTLNFQFAKWAPAGLPEGYPQLLRTRVLKAAALKLEAAVIPGERHAYQPDPMVRSKADGVQLCVCGKREGDVSHAPAPEQAVAQARAHVLGRA
jgi:hypothetical protein